MKVFIWRRSYRSLELLFTVLGVLWKVGGACHLLKRLNWSLKRHPHITIENIQYEAMNTLSM